ncbi:MAG: ABC transporter substrate-binding protein [Egibacteraceae bacterium]
MRGKSFKFLLLLAALLLALGAASCGGDDDGDEGGEGTGATDTGEAQQGGTLGFAGAADPVALDAILVSDGESIRVISQVFETLVALEPGTTEPVPGLATSWEPDAEGTAWTFELREGVTFHDGTPFNAEAVCFNFDRWYHFTGSFQNEDATYYWQNVFGGFADGGGREFRLYQSCEAIDERTVRLNLEQPSASFLAGLALTNFTIASPKALREFGADEGEVDAEGVFQPAGTYGTQHPTGTGPFMFSEWIIGDRLVMRRNPDYWGEFPGNIETLVFRPIPDGAARLQALQTGEIQGYDFVAPEDVQTVEGDPSLQLLERPPYNVGYVGINQAVEPLGDLRVRQAIAHAIDRQEIVDAFYVGRGVVAQEFMPPALFGYAEDVTTYEYDPSRARQILTDAGYTLPVEIPFAFPTDVSRPYMPDPQANFEAVKADLEAAGFAVLTESAAWTPDYLGKIQTGQYGLYLYGWTGDIGDPDNFLGTFFQTPQPEWGFDNPELFRLLDRAEAELDQARRAELYQEANRMIMDLLPGIPYVHSRPTLAFTANVEGYVPSPVTLDPFSLVTVN